VLLKNRLVEPGKLVFLGRIAGLSAISVDGELRIGATTTLREVARSREIVAAAPMLADAAGRVGNARVRALATVGGALVHGDPRQDLPPVLLALGGRVTLEGPAGERTIPLSEFFLGFMETTCGEDELVTAVTVPLPRGRRMQYLRYTPGSDDDYPTVGVAATLVLAEDGTATDASLALGGVGGSALLVSAAARLIGDRVDATGISAVAAAAAAESDPTDDQRGSAGYKREMVRVMTRRALAACITTDAGPTGATSS
jgi:carbon-monoxide dehydrogenase medium subunit